MSDATEYYKTRLEHTLRHTQESTRLIYLVNGAVIALIYFMVEKATSLPRRDWIVLGCLVVLAVVNWLHFLLMRRQGRWYAALDDGYSSAVEQRAIELPGRLSTHGAYAGVHLVITLALTCGFLALGWALLRGMVLFD